MIISYIDAHISCLFLPIKGNYEFNFVYVIYELVILGGNQFGKPLVSSIIEVQTMFSEIFPVKVYFN